MPKPLKIGDNIDVIMSDKPLVSNSSVSTKILTKYGKIELAKGIADFAPLVNALYGLTFLKSA